MIYGIFKKLKQFLCIHDMKRLDNDPPPSIPKGGCVNMIRLHKCKKCDVEFMIGSGYMY